MVPHGDNNLLSSLVVSCVASRDLCLTHLFLDMSQVQIEWRKHILFEQSVERCSCDKLEGVDTETPSMATLVNALTVKGSMYTCQGCSRQRG